MAKKDRRYSLHIVHINIIHTFITYLVNVHILCTIAMYISYERRKCTLNMNPFVHEKHVIRYTQLSELLNITKEKPILVREDLLLNPQQRKMGNTAFVGTPRQIHYDTYTGMPKHLTDSIRYYTDPSS